MSLHLPVKHGARYRLTWLVIACVLPMLALITFIAIDEYRHKRSQLIQKTLLTTRTMALAVDKDLSGVQTGLYALASSPHLKAGDLRAFHHQAKELLRNLNADNIYLVGADGRQLVHTHRPFGEVLPSPGNPFIAKKVLESGNSAVSDLFVGSVVKTPLIAVVVPVRRDDKVIYALGATIHSERLSGILTKHGIPADWIVAIYDSGGHFIARSHGIDKLLGKKGAPAILEKMTSSKEGSLESRTIDGTLILGLFSRLKNSDWTIGIGIPKAKLTEELWRQLGMIAFVTSLILIATLALAWTLGGKIAQSIHALIEPALALGRNENVRVQPLYLREADEVGKAIGRASEVFALTRHLAHHDPLTGLPNRALFNEIIDKQLALCRRYEEPLAVLYMDLDGFKSVNDTHGHGMGDLLLKQVAARLQTEMRRSDVVARLGGDEFAAVLMNTDRAGAKIVAAKLVDILSAPYHLESLSLTHISASAGVAVFPEAGTDVESLLQRADNAMYAAKNAGKRQYAIAEPINSSMSYEEDAKNAEHSFADSDKETC